MSKESKNFWRKSLTGWGWLRAWLILAVATFFIVLIIGLLMPGRPPHFWGLMLLMLAAGIYGLVIATVALGLLVFLGCFFSWRSFKRLLFGLACLATLIALFYAEEDWRGWHDWNQFKSQWEAEGEKFDWQSVVPPPVPDDQNFAMAPIWVESIKATLGPKNASQWKYPDDGRTNFTDRLPTLWRNNDWPDSLISGDWAKGSITDLKAWQTYYRAPAQTKRNSTITTNEFPVAPQPQTPAEDILLALSKYDPAIEELRQASRLPYSRFPLNYDSEDPAVILLPHLALLKRSALVIQLRAIAELQNGESEKALDDVKLSLRLMDSVRTEPFLISHLVRIAMLEEYTLQPIYEGLAEHRWSDAQLVALDAELAKLDFLADYEFCQRGELAFMPDELAYLRRTRDPEGLYYFDFDNNRNHPLDVKLAVFVYRHCPGGWFYQNQIRFCHFAIQNFLPALDVSRQLAFPALASHANAALQKEVAHPNPDNFIDCAIIFRFSSEFYGIGNVVKFAYAQTSVDLARVAIALERYRLANGSFPESLDALAPQFLKNVPHDIIGGGPLHYRLNSDGQFVLYSVGWNETDDGGVVVFNNGSTPTVNRDEGDWVWRYPAKEN
jgi:hypothetical protein